MRKEFYYENRVQLLNPKTKRWIKIDTEKGIVLAHKKNPAAYKHIMKITSQKKPMRGVR